MNTISYPQPTANNSLALSLESVIALEDHGYKSLFSNQLVQFKKNYDLIGPFILFFMYALIALPLFDYSYWLGAAVFICLVLGIYFHRNLTSKTSKIQFDKKNESITFSSASGDRCVEFAEVSGVFIKSKYLGTYSSANKGTSEEYGISIGVELTEGETLTLFSYKSDYQQPSREIMEVHDYVKSVLKPTA